MAGIKSMIYLIECNYEKQSVKERMGKKTPEREQTNKSWRISFEV